MIVVFGLKSVTLIFQCLSFSGCALAASNYTGRHTRTDVSNVMDFAPRESKEYVTFTYIYINLQYKVISGHS